ncbi:lipooligosaccharide transport system ATP-binding protein [Mariprofundus ferrinatatus]|uniref:Lipooligosaccharide transport system ATP-binding protein n=1 Tax=Mariprofundus ferrinatatus TaxID=1921087 RepID=A0A2K8L4A1_9PROT|nr:ATP-binding cassette domain-containing protein [Mariprofundus ferrinatatus]ATX82155.1 lipooligosaccharide transport system ATP-binding protein [Mariprofundus ferrinatatus]
MESVIVSAKALRKTFADREVVCAVNFDVKSGICFGILGPNGAGKTTLMRMLLGLSPVTSGEYTLFGQPVSEASIHTRVGVVPQQDNLDPDFSVRLNLKVYAGYFGIPASVAEPRIEELLEFAALTSRGDDQVSSLSGGMRRRLMIARALINNPDLIVLDEPTTGLDPQARHLIWQRLRSLKNSGKTLILTTHYMEEAAELCDELMVLDRGHILTRGSPRELIAEHVEPEVVAVRGLSNELDAIELCEGLDIRLDHVGDTWFCYGLDARPLVSRCAERNDLIYIHRPASLEDVFLKLTGRDLREDA